MMPKYIFIDTGPLRILTGEHYDALSAYLHKHDLQLVITPMLLVEYFSPKLQTNDRTANAVMLLMEHDFVIANQDTIMDKEEAAYPASLVRLPIAWSSRESMAGKSDEERYQLLYQLFHHGITGTGYDLKAWADNHKAGKAEWIADIAHILSHAAQAGTLSNKEDFVQSLDIRLCNGLELAARQLKGEEKIDRFYAERIKKLDRILKKRDTRLMKGIHLTSLITWYDYVIAKKAVLPSDKADIFHAIIYPYCNVVIPDVSRADVIQRIQREDIRYQQIQCYRIKEFLAVLNA
jgi:hypothetical protein